MKRFLPVLLFPLFSFSQLIGETIGGEFKFNPNNIPCITEEVKTKINAEVDINIINLQQQGKLSNNKMSLAAPAFIWPVKKSATTEFNDVWAISNYVDHDPTVPNKLQDYNCGTRTYDSNSGYNHTGTDIFTWPFSWFQMENNISEVIAAAPGTIIYKNDGQFDKSCDFNSNIWNAVYVQHSDGSTARYGHLKNGSLTLKSLGDTVLEGEYLGILGSSGNSTGPHLHFEVYDASGLLVDPFNGNCNNRTSWWQNQPDYRDPQINAVLAHNAEIEFNTCPAIETTNLQDKFLPNTPVLLYTYYKDQLKGTAATYELYKPNGTLYDSWSENFVNTWGTSWWFKPFYNLVDLGIWTFESSYQGQTITKTFEVTTTLSIEDEKLAQISLAPNPFEGQLKISGFTFDEADYKISVFNQLGQKVLEKDAFFNQLDLQYLSKGMYFLNIGDKTTGGSRTFKIVKK